MQKILAQLQQNYKKLKKIGEGASSETYYAETKNKEQRALKLLVLEKYSKEQAKQMLPKLQNEYQYLQKIDCSFVVKVYQAFFVDQVFVIEQEFVPHGDLQKFIGNIILQFFNTEEVLVLCVQMLLALQQLHEKHLIHRDVKCANILIDFSKVPFYRYVLCDLGLAKQLDHTDEQASTRIGTVHYLSPQIILNQNYSTKTDIWSLGVVLYIANTGHYPFDVNCEPNMENIKNPDLKELISCMLQKEEKDRPSATELLLFDILQPYLDQSKQQSKAQSQVE